MQLILYIIYKQTYYKTLNVFAISSILDWQFKVVFFSSFLCLLLLFHLVAAQAFLLTVGTEGLLSSCDGWPLIAGASLCEHGLRAGKPVAFQPHVAHAQSSGAWAEPLWWVGSLGIRDWTSVSWIVVDLLPLAAGGSPNNLRWLNHAYIRKLYWDAITKLEKMTYKTRLYIN